MPVKSRVVMGSALGVGVNTPEVFEASVVCWKDAGVNGIGVALGVWLGRVTGLADTGRVGLEVAGLGRAGLTEEVVGAIDAKPVWQEARKMTSSPVGRLR